MLPDPERHLSKRHCILVLPLRRLAGRRSVDNGTFLNRERSRSDRAAAPAARWRPPAPRGLRDRGAHRGRGGAWHHARRAAQPLLNPFDEPPLRPPPQPDAPRPLDEDPLLRGEAQPAPADLSPSISLPEDYDPLAPDVGGRPLRRADPAGPHALGGGRVPAAASSGRCCRTTGTASRLCAAPHPDARPRATEAEPAPARRRAELQTRAGPAVDETHPRRPRPLYAFGAAGSATSAISDDDLSRRFSAAGVPRMTRPPRRPRPCRRSAPPSAPW